MAEYAINQKSAFYTIPYFLYFGRDTYISDRCKMAEYFAPPPPPAFGQQAFAPAGAIGPSSPIPGHARLIWLKFIREEMVSVDGRGRFFHPWGRSATTEGDLARRGRAPALMGELLGRGCELRSHRFEAAGPAVAVDATHDVVVLDNYHRMCLETFGRQPKDPAAEGFGQVRDFRRFLVPVDQMLEVGRDPALDRTDCRPFWGPLAGEERQEQEPPTVFILLDDWNPKWVQDPGKSEWASDLLVVNGVWELSPAFRQKAQEIEPLLQLVWGRINVEYCHWKTLHG